MVWDQERYESIVNTCRNDISSGCRTPQAYMKEYKILIINEDFEAAAAVTDVLRPLNYDTADTHRHIKQLEIKN